MPKREQELGVLPVVLPVVLLLMWRRVWPVEPLPARSESGPTRNPLDQPAVTLEVDSGAKVATPAIWFPALQQVVWRVVAEGPGDYAMRLRIGDDSYVKTLRVSSDIARRSPVRLGSGPFGELEYPSEAPLPESAPLASISVAYPERSLDVFGWKLSWIGVYLAQSILFAFVLKTPLGVSL